MSDVLLYQTNDNGEINVEGGVVELSGGLRTSVYLSLFGGNEDDPGGSDTTLSWWGNKVEPDPVRRYRSETQYLLASIPAIPKNLRRIEQAVKRDLQWMIEQRAASEIEVSASVPALNRVAIELNIRAQGREENFNFSENWKANQ
jgi:phage gp46-like protein